MQIHFSHSQTIIRHPFSDSEAPRSSLENQASKVAKIVGREPQTSVSFSDPYVKEFSIKHGQKVRFVFSKHKKTVSGFIENDLGEWTPIQKAYLPKELSKISTFEMFRKFLKQAYVRVGKLENGGIQLHIFQKGLGGNRFKVERNEELKLKLKDINKNVENFNNLDEETKIYTALSVVDILGLADFKPDEYKNAVLVIGKTGIGKTTLISYLKGEKQLYFEGSYKLNEGGHGLLSSTTIPIAHKAGDLVLFDCPGYMNTKGIIYELIDAINILSVVNATRQRKFVIPLDEPSLIDRTHINVFLESINALESYIPNHENLEHEDLGILFVITKGKPKTDEEEKQVIEDNLKELLEGKIENGQVIKISLNPYQEKILKFIREKKRVLYAFKYPERNKKGEIIPVSNEKRGIIIDTIKHQLKPAERRADVKATLRVGESTKNKLVGISEYINKHIQELTQVFGNEVVQHFEKLVNEKKYLFQGISELKKNLEALCKKLNAFHTKNFEDAIAFYKALDEICTNHSIRFSKSLKGSAQPPFPLKGDRNSCYFDSALQAILSIKPLCEFLKDFKIEEGVEKSQEKTEIHQALLSLLEDKQHTKNQCRDSLRSVIFSSGIHTELNQNNSEAQLDAASVFECLIESFLPNSLLKLNETVTSKTLKGLEFVFPVSQLPLFQVALTEEKGFFTDFLFYTFKEEIDDPSNPWNCDTTCARIALKDGKAVVSQEEFEQQQKRGTISILQRTKVYTLQELPEVFFVQFKRFEIVKKNGSSGAKKLETPVILPENGIVYLTKSGPVTAEEYATQPSQNKGCYQIKSIVIHKGSLQAGHYVTRVEVDGTYFEYDNTHNHLYREITQEEFLRTKDSYILGLQKVEEDVAYSKPKPKENKQPGDACDALAQIKKMGQTLSFFKNLVNSNAPIYYQEAWKSSLVEVAQNLRDLIKCCEDLECEQPIKYGSIFKQSNKAQALGFLQYAESFEATEHFEDALGAYAQALAFTNDPEDYAKYAMALLRAGKSNQACGAFYELGNAYKDKKIYSDAIEAYARAYELLPDENDSVYKDIIEACELIKNPEERSKYIKRLAELCEKKNNVAVACQHYEEAYDISHETSLLGKLARLFKKQENPKKALDFKEKYLMEALKEFPEDIELHVKYRNFLKAQKRKEEALEEKQKYRERIASLQKDREVLKVLAQATVNASFSSQGSKLKPEYFLPILKMAPNLSYVDIKGCLSLSTPEVRAKLRELEERQLTVVVIPPDDKPCQGLKCLSVENPFSKESPYFIEKSGIQYKKDDPVGRYRYEMAKDKGVEPGFKATKRFTEADIRKMLKDPQHKYYQEGEAYLRKEVVNELNPIINEKVSHILGIFDTRTFAELPEKRREEVIENLKNMDVIQGLMIEHIENLKHTKYAKIHYLKNDYQEKDRSKETVYIPKENSENIFHYHFTAKNRRAANLNAVRECLANELMGKLGVFTQKLKLIPSQYEDGIPKLILDGTHMEGESREKFYDFSKKLRDGYPIRDEDMKAESSQCETDDTIKNLGAFKVIMLLLADRDAIGSKGDNKGYLMDPENPQKKIFAGIDPGHSLKVETSPFETLLISFENVHTDFSFDQPSALVDNFTGGYKNFTAFDDTPYLEKMQGLQWIANLRDSGRDLALFNEYRLRFNGSLGSALNFEKEIDQMREAFIRRRDYILNVKLQHRLNLFSTEEEEGCLALNIVDCLEKHTSQTSLLSPKEIVKLKYPRVIKRTEWEVEKNLEGFYIFKTRQMTKRIPQDFLKGIEGIKISESHNRAGSKTFFKLTVECPAEILESLNQKLDEWNQYENWKKTRSSSGK